MKLIINASNLSTTGVVQVTLSFIHECIKYTKNEYHIFMSKTIESQIDQSLFPANFKFYTIKFHPAYNINGFKTRRLLSSLEKKIKPDCVFTAFGPSWWTPKSPHLIGYALAHYLYPESPLFKILPLKKLIKIKIYSIVHRYFFRQNGKYYVCETEDVSDRLAKFLKCDPKKVFTVTNTYNDFFNSYRPSTNIILPPKMSNEFRLVTMSSFVTHKNITILNEVIPLLKKQPDYKIKFILTIDSNLLRQNITVEAQSDIVNLGRIPASECPAVYDECDALFLPTLMECFSANFPEAMKMRKPVLTSNLPFATNVCGDAALYFDPLNPHDIAEKILLLIKDEELQKALIAKGEARLNAFESAESRASKYLSICETIKSMSSYN